MSQAMRRKAKEKLLSKLWIKKRDDDGASPAPSPTVREFNSEDERERDERDKDGRQDVVPLLSPHRNNRTIPRVLSYAGEAPSASSASSELPDGWPEVSNSFPVPVSPPPASRSNSALSTASTIRTTPNIIVPPLAYMHTPTPNPEHQTPFYTLPHRFIPWPGGTNTRPLEEWTSHVYPKAAPVVLPPPSPTGLSMVFAPIGTVNGSGGGSGRGSGGGTAGANSGGSGSGGEAAALAGSTPSLAPSKDVSGEAVEARRQRRGEAMTASAIWLETCGAQEPACIEGGETRDAGVVDAYADGDSLVADDNKAADKSIRNATNQATNERTTKATTPITEQVISATGQATEQPTNKGPTTLTIKPPTQETNQVVDKSILLSADWRGRKDRQHERAARRPESREGRPRQTKEHYGALQDDEGQDVSMETGLDGACSGSIRSGTREGSVRNGSVHNGSILNSASEDTVHQKGRAHPASTRTNSQTSPSTLGSSAKSRPYSARKHASSGGTSLSTGPKVRFHVPSASTARLASRSTPNLPYPKSSLTSPSIWNLTSLLSSKPTSTPTPKSPKAKAEAKPESTAGSIRVRLKSVVSKIPSRTRLRSLYRRSGPEPSPAPVPPVPPIPSQFQEGQPEPEDTHSTNSSHQPRTPLRSQTRAPLGPYRGPQSLPVQLEPQAAYLEPSSQHQAQPGPHPEAHPEAHPEVQPQTQEATADEPELIIPSGSLARPRLPIASWMLDPRGSIGWNLEHWKEYVDHQGRVDNGLGGRRNGDPDQINEAEQPHREIADDATDDPAEQERLQQHMKLARTEALQAPGDEQLAVLREQQPQLQRHIGQERLRDLTPGANHTANQSYDNSYDSSDYPLSVGNTSGDTTTHAPNQALSDSGSGEESEFESEGSVRISALFGPCHEAGEDTADISAYAEYGHDDQDTPAPDNNDNSDVSDVPSVRRPRSVMDTLLVDIDQDDTQTTPTASTSASATEIPRANALPPDSGFHKFLATYTREEREHLQLLSAQHEASHESSRASSPMSSPIRSASPFGSATTLHPNYTTPLHSPTSMQPPQAISRAPSVLDLNFGSAPPPHPQSAPAFSPPPPRSSPPRPRFHSPPSPLFPLVDAVSLIDLTTSDTSFATESEYSEEEEPQTVYSYNDVPFLPPRKRGSRRPGSGRSLSAR